jgi:KDO2-lipid IV(A) lauroyltransferase
MLVDQKMNDGIPVPFFGRKAMTSQGIAKLALQFNYPIVPCQIIRKKGCYFKQIIYPPLSINKTGDDEKDCYNIMLEINQIFEKWIIQNPSQWFWFHNRWGK